MSKLFDTLEQIQEQEISSPAPEKHTPAQPARKTGRYFPFLVGLTIAVALMAAGQHLPAIKKLFVKDQSTSITRGNRNHRQPAPASAANHADTLAPKTTTAMPDSEQVEYYNNHAVALSRKGDTWAALYYFDKASKLAPKQPEPLINMAILLTQMDLGFPAARIFKQAYELSPDNDYLLQAIELAITEQVLPPDFYESVPQPGRKDNN